MYEVQPIVDRSFIGSMKREASRFTSSWTDTQEMLLAEVASLKGSRMVVRLDVTPDQLRRDGMLKANARSMSDAVVVEFETPTGAMSFSLDRYSMLPWNPKMKSLWQHNVRAIALTLRALRAVDRYGSQRGEQYAGFKAIGGGTGAAPSGMTLTEAIQTVIAMPEADPAALAGMELPEFVSPASIKRARRWAHPDAMDGDRTAWDRLEKAVDTLNRAGRIRQ